MRALPPSLSSELAKEAHYLRTLVEISLSTSTLYYTDADMDIYHNGKVYLSRGLAFDVANLSLLPKVDSLSVELDNVQLEMSSVMMNNEVRGRQFTVYRVALDQYLNVLATALLFLGQMDRISYDHQRCRIEVYNQFIKWQTPTPRRKHITTCAWTFRDSETCRYAGAETSCDKSWDSCATKFNTLNFGGFRWLTDLQDKQIWWGRVPS